jgi:serine/threonine protein kinase
MVSAAETPTGNRVIADRYQLLAEVGRGGMGVVWRAQDRLIGRPVAVKELVRVPGSADPQGEAAQRMLREVRATGRLNHRAAVTVYDAVWQDGCAHIVMEFVDAPSLTQLVNRSGPMPPRQVAAMGLEVLGALRQAHDAGIVHRDVKPSNIMVLPEGQGAKLADFGIAQVRGETRLTRTGMVIGSPAFLAPEQINGDRATPATDLWQLGVMLYYALEGRSPFDRETDQATVYAVLGSDPAPPRCGEPLASTIVSLLAKDPERRPESGELRTALERCLMSSGERRGAPARATRVATRHSAQRSPASSETPDPSSRGPGRRSRWWGRVLLGTAAVLALAAASAGAGVLVDHFLIVPDVSRHGPASAVAIPWSARGANSATSVELSGLRFPDRGCAGGEVQPGQALNQVDCAVDHRVEVWDSFRIPRDDTSSAYPDPTFVGRTARMTCEGSLASYVRQTPELRTAGLGVAVLVPDQRTWSDDSSFGNAAYCALWRTDGQPIRGHQLAPVR